MKRAYRSSQYHYPIIDANFGGRDGSIRNFQVPIDITEGFVKAGTQLVPEDFAE